MNESQFDTDASSVYEYDICRHTRPSERRPVICSNSFSMLVSKLVSTEKHNIMGITNKFCFTFNKQPTLLAVGYM